MPLHHAVRARLERRVDDALPGVVLRRADIEEVEKRVDEVIRHIRAVDRRPERLPLLRMVRAVNRRRPENHRHLERLLRRVLLDVARERAVPVVERLTVVRDVDDDRVLVREFAHDARDDEVIVVDGIRVLRDLRALPLREAVLRRRHVGRRELREEIGEAHIVEPVAAHQVNQVEILLSRRLQGLIDEREQRLIVDAIVLMRLAQSREAAVVAAAREQLRDIAPDARALLIREPVRPVARRLHRVDHVVVGVPGL